MTVYPFPHPTHLDELQLQMVPLTHEFPYVQSLINWIQTITGHGQPTLPTFALTFHLPKEEDKLEEYIHKFASLNQLVRGLAPPLKRLLFHLADFEPHHKPLKEALIQFNEAFEAIPPIEPDIHLVKLGHTLYQSPEIVERLAIFVEKTTRLLEQASKLKAVIFDHIIDRLSVETDDTTHITDTHR